MLAILIIYGVLVVVELSLIFSFAFKFKKPQSTASKEEVSILVCARNEEENLPTLLDSLLQSDYDFDQIEILIGDDDSTDNTKSIIEDYGARFSFIKYVSIENEKDGLIAKGNVLSQLVDVSQYARILIIDADMVVNSSWLPTMSSLLTENDLVSGFTLIDQKIDGSGTQFFDWAVVLHTMKSMADLSKPISILGNNMGFKRQAYEQVGGFRGLGPTDVEDLGLLRRFENEKLNCFQFVGDKGFATTKPQVGFKAALEQRVRWMNGVFAHHWVLAIPAIFARLWFVIGAALLFYSNWAFIILGYGFLLNAIKFWQMMSKYKQPYMFSFLAPINVSLLDTFALVYRMLFGKVSWKGRRF